VQMMIYPQGQYQGTGAYFYSRDHLGSIREMTDASGTVVARYDYDPFGRSTTVIGTNKPDFNFTGLYRHSPSNLDLAVYRAYDPDLGRWLSRDPIAELGGVNLYAYVADNPVHARDPFGLYLEVGPGDMQYFTEALNYLSRDSGMNQIFNDLRNSATTYRLVTNNNDDDSYDPRTKTINWDPHSALRMDCNGKQSPALGLGHEAAHADGPWYSGPLALIPSSKYDNYEERRVIMGPETSAAITLGEDTRTNHGGQAYWVPSPTSR